MLTVDKESEWFDDVCDYWDVDILIQYGSPKMRVGNDFRFGGGKNTHTYYAVGEFEDGDIEFETQKMYIHMVKQSHR